MGTDDWSADTSPASSYKYLLNYLAAAGRNVEDALENVNLLHQFYHTLLEGSIKKVESCYDT